MATCSRPGWWRNDSAVDQTPRELPSELARGGVRDRRLPRREGGVGTSAHITPHANPGRWRRAPPRHAALALIAWSCTNRRSGLEATIDPCSGRRLRDLLATSTGRTIDTAALSDAAHGFDAAQNAVCCKAPATRVGHRVSRSPVPIGDREGKRRQSAFLQAEDGAQAVLRYRGSVHAPGVRK